MYRVYNRRANVFVWTSKTAVSGITIYMKAIKKSPILVILKWHFFTLL